MSEQPNFENNLTQVLKRFWAVQFEDDYDKAASQRALAREYVRRSALWAKTLNVTEKWPFFDVALYTDPSVRAPQEMLMLIESHFVKSGFYGFLMTDIFQWMIHFAALKDRFPAKLPPLSDPYEPVLIIYERGGTISFHHGTIYTSGIGFWRGGWASYMEQVPIAVDDNVLDQIDREFNAKYRND